MLDNIKDIELLYLYSDYNKVMGPYIRKSDNRRILVLVMYGTSYKTAKRTKTIPYAKALMEVHLNRRLSYDEVVHHKDGNKLNDTLHNLEVVNRKFHTHDHFMKYHPYSVTCSVCGKYFEVTHKHHLNHEKGDNWCCSKRCAGILGSRKSHARVVE